jgi:hypothetical protein
LGFADTRSPGQSAVREHYAPGELLGSPEKEISKLQKFNREESLMKVAGRSKLVEVEATAETRRVLLVGVPEYVLRNPDFSGVIGEIGAARARGLLQSPPVYVVIVGYR